MKARFDRPGAFQMPEEGLEPTDTRIMMRDRRRALRDGRDGSDTLRCLQVVERLIELMRERFGSRLQSVWLYGSRVRGELPGRESEIDLMAIADPDGGDDILTAILLVDQAAE